MFRYLGPLTRSLAEVRHPMIGFMVTPDSDRTVLLDVAWAADNGCFAAGEAFSLDRYLSWLARPRRAVERCLFATAPDVVGDAAATWERSAPVLPQLRALGYRAALVAQDGFDAAAVDWTAFDCLFIGGAPRTPRRAEWKRRVDGGFAAISEARARRKYTHVGRVNGWPFLWQVVRSGADSADGTMLRFGPDRHWPTVSGWMDTVAQRPMFDWEATP